VGEYSGESSGIECRKSPWVAVHPEGLLTSSFGSSNFDVWERIWYGRAKVVYLDAWEVLQSVPKGTTLKFGCNSTLETETAEH